MTSQMQRYLKQQIEISHGWIPFHEYMKNVLYSPEIGYYCSPGFQFGNQGDFTTAPEMGEIFGYAISQAVYALMQQCHSTKILEFGAGSGKLARSILDGLPETVKEKTQYNILELSAPLTQLQKQTLSSFEHVQWLNQMPDVFEGVVIANEVLDAMPVHLVRFSNNVWFEVGVCLKNDHLCFEDKPCSQELLEAIHQRIENQNLLPDGYLTEIHLYCDAWIRTLSQMCTHTKSAAIIIDYGFPKQEYYLPQRNTGTLMCHYRHQSNTDVFFMPGQQDITAHVDFSSIAQQAISCQMDVLCYTSQAQFLLGCGILDIYQHYASSLSTVASAQCLSVLQKLLSPAEMGELFKVMVLANNIKPPEFMIDIDKSGRL